MYESVPRVPITEAIISRGVACAFDGERREKYDSDKWLPRRGRKEGLPESGAYPVRLLSRFLAERLKDRSVNAGD